MLYRQTRGHPLFTVELLRGLQERGDLVQDPEGRWVEGPALDWETLPARVEAVIAERIGRLAEPLQAALRVASVEGEVFTAEVVARVQAADETGDGAAPERRVGPEASPGTRPGHRAPGASGACPATASGTILFQRYLYDSLDEVERAYLHEDVGNALEELYRRPRRAQDRGDVAESLCSWRGTSRKRGYAKKAIHYLHQAGERAVQLSAYQEAIAHLTRGLALLMALPDSALKRAQQELALQLALGMAWVGTKGYGPEAKEAYTRARELCRRWGRRLSSAG